MTVFQVNPDLLCLIPPEKHSVEDITKILEAHPEIKFVSLAGIDLAGNDTDERIPIKDFHDNIQNYLDGEAIQTDGSSVVLPGIATLNDGKVDLVPDSNVVWYIDYNYEHIDNATGLPTGTLRIPSFLYHNGEPVCSRSVLKRSADYFESKLMSIFNEHPELCEEYGFTLDELSQINLIVATELEFWVNSPDEKISSQKLTISQELKEQYWKRTKGVVRTALEQVILVLDLYGFNPEMGHKEVGGVKPHISNSGDFHGIMEQLEVDWKYSDALQGADYELIARILIKEIFRLHGLEVSFNAKPIKGVAGSGEHTHVNAVAHLKNGKKVNLFSPKNMNEDYLSVIGWGSLMGIMKNYNLINPFVSATIDAFNRLQPGFEAPTHAIASIGKDVMTPSRNRTVLLGLIRNLSSKHATRFELRSPNPHTNTYLCLSAIYQCMLDGIAYAVNSGKNSKELEAEFTKPFGTKGDYLETNRLYRCEEDIFESMTEDQRNFKFGTPPTTVYDSLKNFISNASVSEILCAGDVFSDKLLRSYSCAMLDMWQMELVERIIPSNISVIRNYTKLHDIDNSYDSSLWQEIQRIKIALAKNTDENYSVFGSIKSAIENKNLNEISKLQIRMNLLMNELASLYKEYSDNQI
ncbi:MAG: glutamine synthetase [Clostridia bacterium]|nr:glutamine synthetase [Clostridia bacterium]